MPSHGEMPPAEVVHLARDQICQDPLLWSVHHLPLGMWIPPSQIRMVAQSQNRDPSPLRPNNPQACCTPLPRTNASNLERRARLGRPHRHCQAMRKRGLFNASESQTHDLASDRLLGRPRQIVSPRLRFECQNARWCTCHWQHWGTPCRSPNRAISRWAFCGRYLSQSPCP